MNNISFDNAYLLLIALPLIALFTVLFAIVTRKENANGHSTASYILHIVLAIIIAFAAAGTTITTVLTETNVYVVADVSYSASKNLDAIDGYIRNLKLPRNSKLGVVCFGKDFEVISEMGDPSRVKSVKNSNVDDSETNIAEALDYTGTLFKEDVIKRIVLITDGRQTDEADSYAIKRAVDGLEAQDITVDAIYIDSNLSADVKEVQISNVEFSNTAFLNSDEWAVVTVQSTYQVNAIISLYRNGEKERDMVMELQPGYNTKSLQLITSVTGTFDYEVSIEAEGDDSSYNNSYLFTQIVSSDIKVLAITENWDDVKTVVERYGGKATVEVYEYSSTPVATKNSFINQYDSAKIKVHINNLRVPFTLEDLCKYDEIILADVNVTELTNYTEFIRNVDLAVSEFGKSLVTFGNLHVQTSTEEEVVDFKKMLPVNYGGNDETKMYTFVIDSSRSMLQMGRFNLAKDLCARLIDLLNDDDYICVVTFNGEVRMVQPPRQLTSRSDVIDVINKLDARQGTVIGSGLQMAYEYMDNDSLYGNRQVMLITDGNRYGGGSSDDPVAVAQQMYEDGIETSVVDVSMGAYSGAPALLKNVAAAGHGGQRNTGYFNTDEDGELSNAQFGEMTQGVTVATINKTASVSIIRRTDEVLTGVNVNGIGTVGGYVYSNAKASATTVLAVNHERANGTTTPKPLYAYWSYGNGKVSTFNSQMNGSWISSWSSGGALTKFVDNVFSSNTPEMKSSVPYAINLIQEGKTAYVEITPAVPRLNATARIEVTRPDDASFAKTLDLKGTYYFYEFETVGVGKYTIKVTYNYYNTDHIEDVIFNISYTPEYNAFATYDSSSLHKAIDGRGTVVEEQNLTVDINEEELATYNVALTVPLLIAAVSLFVVDIIVRKLKWNDIKSFFSFFKKLKIKKRRVNE